MVLDLMKVRMSDYLAYSIVYMLASFQRSGLTPSNEQYDSILNWFATRGLVEGAESYMSQLAIGMPVFPSNL